MNRYIGITIGPIVSTISKAQQTGQLWGSSYIFSYLMKEIISELIIGDGDAFIDKNSFILPSTYLINNDKVKTEATEEQLAKVKGVGLYPDRIIFRSKDGDYELLEKVIDKVLNKLSEEITKVLNNVDKVEIYKYLKEFFQISYIETEIEDPADIIKKVNSILDVIELQNKAIPIEKHDYLLELISNDKIKDSFLAKDSYDKEIKKFKTIEEIALGKQDVLMGKKHKKYIAVVQSDGDNVGKIIANLKTEKELQIFSQKLLQYASNTNEIIKEFGGYTIYAGGDDLLFFAPVIYDNENEKHIFNLLQKLNDTFISEFKAEISEIENYNLTVEADKKIPVPGLSFGVSISYKSFPLKEALGIAIDSLFGASKNYTAESDEKKIEKNAVTINVLKHSGQEFKFTSNITEESYKLFLDMFNESLCKKPLNSVLYKFRRDEKIIQAIAHDEARVDSYINNNFRDEHKEAGAKYFEDLKKLITQVFSYDKDESAIRKLHSYLKFISFAQEEGN